MPNQIVLAWTVKVAGTSRSPAQAAAQLSAAPLYDDTTTDPVLGQLFGLTVASDVTTNDTTSATRTLTLNMTSAAGAPFAPPPFPSHPDTVGPPTLPFVLRKRVPLAGSFLTTPGSGTVGTSADQRPALNHLDVIEFLSQLGVYYTVNTISASSIALTGPYTGSVVADGAAVRVLPAPVKFAALYSTSPLDTSGVATVPAIPAGSGAQTVSLSYTDSAGGGPFTVVTSLTGKRPAAVALAFGSIDIATITDLHDASNGAFGNSVGQITLCELASALPPIPANATPDDFRNLTDQAQLLITRALAYLPPSYFALAQQGPSRPVLAGDFLVTTGSTNVFTAVDQTGVLAAGNTIQFASQLENDTPFGTDSVTYTVQTVSPSIVELTTPYTGLNASAKRSSDLDRRPNDFNARANKQPTAAFRVTPVMASTPSNAQLASPLAQFVNPGTAVPPPNPPLPPETMTPAPVFLSDLFTQTLQLALAGVPISPATITFV